MATDEQIEIQAIKIGGSVAQNTEQFFMIHLCNYFRDSVNQLILEASAPVA